MHMSIFNLFGVGGGGDFGVFRSRGETRFTDGDEIRPGGNRLPYAKFHPVGAGFGRGTQDTENFCPVISYNAHRVVSLARFLRNFLHSWECHIQLTVRI